MSKRNLTLTLTLIVLVIFGALAFFVSRQPAQHPDHAYISQSQAECEKILFTCPYMQEPFFDSTGCGCKPLPEGAEDDAEARRLDYLINRYLAGRVLEPSHAEGEVFADFRLLDATKDEKELDYQVYALVQEFYPEEGTLYPGEKILSPIALQIEETSKNYIVWKHTVPSTNNFEQDVDLLFTSEAQDWIYEGDHDFADRTMRSRVRSMASLAFGLPVHEEAPTDESETETEAEDANETENGSEPAGDDTEAANDESAAE